MQLFLKITLNFRVYNSLGLLHQVLCTAQSGSWENYLQATIAKAYSHHLSASQNISSCQLLADGYHGCEALTEPGKEENYMEEELRVWSRVTREVEWRQDGKSTQCQV